MNRLCILQGRTDPPQIRKAYQWEGLWQFKERNFETSHSGQGLWNETPK